MKTNNIQSILIANRWRNSHSNCKTAKQMGIKTYGIYTTKET